LLLEVKAVVKSAEIYYNIEVQAFVDFKLVEFLMAGTFF